MWKPFPVFGSWCKNNINVLLKKKEGGGALKYEQALVCVSTYN